MANPWLSIPLTDYEAHMNAASVQQLGALSQLFQRALAICRPESVAVLGIAGGNGLEQIDRGVTKRIVGLDINPAFLEEARGRFAALPGLELRCLDLAEPEFALPSVDLVHAALIFEHVGLGCALQNALSMVASGGKFSVVLQLPGAEEDVAPTPYASIQQLKPGFALIDTRAFEALLNEQGFQLAEREVQPVAGGKALWMGIFARRQ